MLDNPMKLARRLWTDYGMYVAILAAGIVLVLYTGLEVLRRWKGTKSR